MKYILFILLFFTINSKGQSLYLFGGIDTILKIPIDTIPTEIDTTIGTPIETFGANPFYRKFLSNLTFTPQIGNSTLITYTGIGDPFNNDYVGKEFVDISRNNLNPGSYPIPNVINGNYWPGIRSCRYSVVTSIIDGKNLYVNFKYNGGDTITPQTKTLQSGYFFYDNKVAITSSMASADTIVKLKGDSTYVIKGGFNSALLKNVMFFSPTRSSIKLSIEDPFLSTYQAFNKITNTSNSYQNTFGSTIFWWLPINYNYNLEIRNINLLAPNWIMESADLGNMPANWITQGLVQVSSSSNNFIGGNRTLYGVNTETEYNTEGSSYGNFVNIQFMFSDDGGKLEGNDVSQQDMQWWNIIKSNVTAREPFGLKGNKRAGNVFHVDSSTVSTNSRGRVGNFESLMSFSTDTDGRRNIITLHSDTVNWERLKSSYNWNGGFNHNYDIYYNETRWEYYDINDSNDSTWRLYWANNGSFADKFSSYTGNAFLTQSSPVLSSKKLRVNEDIPYVGQVLTIDGVKNKKINDTTFVIEDIGLQAKKTYPGLLMAFWVDTAKCLAGGGFVGSQAYNHPWCYNRTTNYWHELPNDTTKFYYTLCDTLEYNGVKYAIVARKRYSRATVVPGARKVYWLYTISAPIVVSNPSFTVTTSRTEFLLTGQHLAFLKAYPMGAYGNLTYSNKSLNTIFKNSTFNGFIRATEVDGINKFDATGPLYLHNRWKVFDNVTWTGAGYQEMFGSGLYYRNIKEGYNGKTGPWKVYISGGNIVAPSQTPTNDPVSTGY